MPRFTAEIKIGIQVWGIVEGEENKGKQWIWLMDDKKNSPLAFNRDAIKIGFPPLAGYRSKWKQIENKKEEKG